MEAVPHSVSCVACVRPGAFAVAGTTLHAGYHVYYGSYRSLMTPNRNAIEAFLH